MQDQSQKDDMRAALRGDRERMLERWREEGREPVFVRGEDPEPEPEPEEPPVAAAPPSLWEPEPVAVEVAAEPEPATEPEPPPRRSFGARLRRLLGRRPE